MKPEEFLASKGINRVNPPLNGVLFDAFIELLDGYKQVKVKEMHFEIINIVTKRFNEFRNPEKPVHLNQTINNILNDIQNIKL